MRISGRVSERDGSSSTRARALLAALDENADQLEKRRFVGIHSSHPRKGDLAAMQRGLFRIGDDLRELSPPIDWADEPYASSDEYAFLLNCFIFADPLLVAEVPDAPYREVISSLAAIVADWIAQNPRADHPRPHKYAWYDHAAAARLVHLAYLLREASRLQLLSAEQRRPLAQSIIEHADFVLAEENYLPGHNHGLFSDAAIKLAADTLPFAPESAEWAAGAIDRFGSVVDLTIETTEGVHLEHSPGYQLVVRGALHRFGPAELLPQPEMAVLLERMDEATAWLTSPDGTLPPIGDTVSGVEPARAVQERAARTRGIKAFARSGYCVVRDRGSYLIVTAGFHSTAHKHADDLGYCLYESGRALVGDAGNAGYDYAGPERQYCVSPRAHSNVSVDAYTWIDDPRGGYGSGLVAIGTGEKWYAILAENPRIAPDERVARRLFLYRPGSALAVVDEVSARDDEVVERYLQLAPELSVTGLDTGTITIERDNGSRVAALTTMAGEANPSDLISAVRGRTSPPLGGIFFPKLNSSQPCTTLVVSRNGGGMCGYVLALDTEAPPISNSSATGSLAGARAEVNVSGLGDTVLNVRLDNGALRLATG